MKLFKALTFCVLLTQSNFTQWTNPDLTLTGRQIQCFVNKDLSVLAGTDGGLVLSTNKGQSWTGTSGLPYPNVRALLKVESYPFNLLAGMVSGRVSMSTNFGNDFTGFPTDSVQLPFLANINCILKRSNSSNFLVGTERGVYLLPQYYPLSTWIPVNTGLPSAETKVRAFVEKDGEVFAGTNGGVFQMNGYDWVQKNTGLTNTDVTALASIGGFLYAGTRQGSIGGVYISSDNGNNWTLSLNDAWISSFLTLGSNIFTGSVGNGIWRSTNFGNTWIQINDGLGSGAYNVLSIGADDQYLFAGTVSSSIWRRPLSQVVTDTEDETNLQPKEFSLNQNYPNPFNPSTRIQYQVSGVSHINLKVYDVLGNEVATLVNEEKQTGSYEVEFNASELSSGIYFYKLTVVPMVRRDLVLKDGQAGSFSEIKKMTLLR